jgi:FAD/FMN-containing dehydrogenase
MEKCVAAFGSDLASDAPVKYRTEPRGRFYAPEMPLLRPRTTQQVSDIVVFCNDKNIGIIPYGGGTGLVSGQVNETADGKLILSLERMNEVREINPDDNAMTVEAGVILENVQKTADKTGLLFPLSLASQGSCQIGGNLATNAGGVQVLRYGNARDLCLGIEAVLPDGSIYHGLKSLRKDNTGYDIRNLLIGAEGTLGIITAACLKLFPKPQQKATAILTVRNPATAVKLLSKLNAKLDGAITAFELLHAQSFMFLAEKMPHVRLPFTTMPEWSVLIELSLGTGVDATTQLTDALAIALENEMVLDAVIAQSVSQATELWNIRESIPEANRLIGAIASHDISIPISRIPEFIKKTPSLLKSLGALRISCFGHLGDGNLHYNIYPPQGGLKEDYIHLRDEVTQIIHQQTDNFGGSISAEHGIGRLKRGDLERFGDPAKLSAMRSIKAALDPNNIMNPGAVISQN